MLDVLAFGAHPDDVEIFAGGTVALCVRRGLRVGVAHLTRGELGTRGSPELRAQEAKAAAQILGVTLTLVDLGDGHINDDDRCRASVVELLRRERPRLVLAQLPTDDHPDHAATGALLKSSCYLAGIRRYAAAPGDSGKTDAPHRPAQLWFYPSHEIPEPSLVVRLAREDVDKKMASIHAYASQVHDPKSGGPETRISRPEFLEAIVARLRTFGGRIGAEFGEPFRVNAPIAVDDPGVLLQ